MSCIPTEPFVIETYTSEDVQPGDTIKGNLPGGGQGEPCPMTGGSA